MLQDRINKLLAEKLELEKKIIDMENHMFKIQSSQDRVQDLYETIEVKERIIEKFEKDILKIKMGF